MLHTCATQPRLANEAAKSRDMLQMQNLTWNLGWNDHQDEDLPGYHPDSLAWSLDESAASGQPQYFTDSQFTVADAANSLVEPKREKASNSNFCGLQHWYSTGTQEYSSVTPAATTQPQLSDSEFKFYESTSFDEESQLSDQSCSSQLWSPNISGQLSSVSDEALDRVPCIDLTVDLTHELDNDLIHYSKEENARVNTAQADASKKRKIAHSIIESNYRSRIKSGMSELRQCVPPTARGSSLLDYNRPGSRQVADNAARNQSSGKVATLSDAVQYVKELELEREALHGRLDVMQRRNNTLQKIAMSKVSTNTPETSTNMEKMEDEDTEADDEGSPKQAGKQEKQEQFY